MSDARSITFPTAVTGRVVAAVLPIRHRWWLVTFVTGGLARWTPLLTTLPNRHAQRAHRRRR